MPVLGRFFLTAPELSRLAEEAQLMGGSPTTTRKEQHDQSLAVWTRQEENIARLKTVLISSMNPMKYEGEPAQYHHNGCDAS